MKVNAPKAEELHGGGSFLKTPGIYQFLVVNVNPGVGPKGKSIDGFTTECKVMGGIAADGSDQAGKECSITFFAPNLNSTAKAQAANERQNTAFFIATNCLSPDMLGQDDLEVDETLAVGAQFIAQMVYGQKKNDDGVYVEDPSAPLQVHFADIYHVDDPHVAKIPKNAESIALIEPKDRHNADWFAWKKKGESRTVVAAAASSNFADDIF